MERNVILGIVAFAVVALGVAGFAAAQGMYGFGDGARGFNGAGSAEMQGQHQAMQEAIANGDFDAWKSLQETRLSEMQDQLTEENFNQMVERHNEMQEFRDAMQEARESGDFSKVQELKEQYGIEGGFGRGMGGRGGFEGCPMHEALEE